jgi:hypothetical protein
MKLAPLTNQLLRYQIRPLAAANNRTLFTAKSLGEKDNCITLALLAYLLARAPGRCDHTPLTIVSFANAIGIQIYSIPEFAGHLLMLLV